MNWEQLLSLKRQGDTSKRLRVEQDDTRLGFEVDYDRIIFFPTKRPKDLPTTETSKLCVNLV